jgi:hypothetical protein
MWRRGLRVALLWHGIAQITSSCSQVLKSDSVYYSNATLFAETEVSVRIFQKLCRRQNSNLVLCKPTRSEALD